MNLIQFASDIPGLNMDHLVCIFSSDISWQLIFPDWIIVARIFTKSFHFLKLFCSWVFPWRPQTGGERKAPVQLANPQKMGLFKLLTTALVTGPTYTTQPTLNAAEQTKKQRHTHKDIDQPLKSNICGKTRCLSLLQPLITAFAFFAITNPCK